MFNAPRFDRVGRLVMLRASGALAVILGVGLSAGSYTTLLAQNSPVCAADVEPNNEVAGAAPLSGAFCVEGAFTAGDQDLFLWTVPAGSSPSWSLSLRGLPGEATGLKMLQATVAADGTRTPGDQIYAISGTPEDDSVSVGRLVVRPGTYLLGLAPSGGAGPYHLIVQPEPLPQLLHEREPNETAETATPLTLREPIAGDSAGGDDVFAVDIDARSARKRWTLAAAMHPGAWVTIALEDAKGTTLLTHSQRSSGPFEIPDLALKEGRSYFRVSRNDAETPYVLQLNASGPRTASREEEPNETFALADPIEFATPVGGRLGRYGDVDMYGVTIDERASEERVDIALESKDIRLTFCLYDDKGFDLQCRSGKAPTLSDLLLPVGHYAVAITGSSDSSAAYTVQARFAGVPPADSEREPNDKAMYATPIKAGTAVSARASVGDVDHFRIEAEGEPQLWSFTTRGKGVVRIAVQDSKGAAIAGADGDREGESLTLPNVFLLPGSYVVAVTANDAVYDMTAAPIGAPDPTIEREPNNSVEDAHRLQFGLARTGYLTDINDRDNYRFSLGARTHVALELTPPAEANLRLDLEWGWPSSKRPSVVATGKVVVYDAFLEPGDYRVQLKAERPASGPYKIVLNQRDPFDMPSDVEPNDTASQAQPLPADFVVNGLITSPDDADWFNLPVAAQATTLKVRLTAPNARGVEADVFDGDQKLASEWNAESGVFSAETPAARPLKLRIRGEGAYAFDVSFTAGPTAGLRPSALPLTMSIDPAKATIAAYWIRGQRLRGHVTLTNTGPKALGLTLDLQSSHFAVTPSLAVSSLRLEPGATQQVPVEFAVAKDVWAEKSIQVAVRARTQSGGQQTAIAIIEADPSAAPVAEEVAFPLPEALLGGFNVGWSALGALIEVSDTITNDTDKEQLNDGIIAGGYSVLAEAAPVTITTKFGGDKSWPIAGLAIFPQHASALFPPEQVRDFDLLLSDDGRNFEVAYSGHLTMLPMEQAFVLEKPRRARAAQLRLKSNHADNLGKIGFGEWKLIASPGELSGTSLNIAEARRGGHVVRANPLIGEMWDDARGILEDGGDPAEVEITAGQKPEWVVGFHESRAAQIVGFEWQEGEGRSKLARFQTVRVSVAMESPLGPWRDIGHWSITRDEQGKAAWSLPEPIWARYVRFESVEAQENQARWAYPQVLRIMEKPIGNGYLSILGEWGQNNRDAIYEATRKPDPEAALAQGTEGATKQTAQALALGTMAAGEVQLDVREQWYRIETPLDHDTLALTVSSEPSVDVDLALEDEAGAPVRLHGASTSPTEIVQQAKIKPGGIYYLKVHEPPHSVAFAYDTSLSLAAFAPVVHQTVRTFADGVKRGREFVNVMNFETPLLLKEWTDFAWVMQGAVAGITSESGSSDLERTMLSLSEAMMKRRGARAAILVTDADSPSYVLQDELWQRMAMARPRVFSAYIAVGAHPLLERQIMQDLANVNGGYFAAARTQAEMDIVSDRAAAWLRRARRYRLTAQAVTLPPPKPGSIAVVARGAAAAGAPASAPPASSPVDASDAPVGPGANAVEIILDASGSMLQRLQGKRRIEIARNVLNEAIGKTVPEGSLLAFRVFGDDKPGSCETRLAIPAGPLDTGAAKKLIARVQPKNKAKTPIAASLRLVSEDLASVKGTRTVVLVTDGEETCGGDPQAEIDALAKSGIDVRINIVGFAVDDAALKETFRTWAASGRGQYFDARDSAELSVAMKAAVGVPFRVLDDTGAEMGKGTVGSEALPVPPGIYRVEVGTGSPLVFEQVSVEPEQAALLEYVPN